MNKIKEINIEDYNYPLPEEQIAFFPKEKRSASKLLYYNNGDIEDRKFEEITQLLNSDSMLVFNDSKVIKARMWFAKTTGAIIEVFCLEPSELDMAVALGEKNKIKWNCYVKGARKWKSGPLSKEVMIANEKINLQVEKGEQKEDYFEILFSWNGDCTFSEILEEAGNIPLPPYIQRDTDSDDSKRYQTVYSDEEGSVAAPTAGLHFTNDIISAINNKGVSTHFLTLHVGAGTFKPVKVDAIGDHYMHEEYFEVKRSTIENILNLKNSNQSKKVIAVGTTSVRTLESLYWLGCKIEGKITSINIDFTIEQWEIYQDDFIQLSVKESLENLLQWMNHNERSSIIGSTKLMIAPGYTFRIVNGIFTNFHLPKSTLLLLVSALIGEDWKKVYNHALELDYRFLSYGDSSLLMSRLRSTLDNLSLEQY